MYVYLSKKIAIPNNVRLNCIAWNQKKGYIAVGGEDGLLKVIRADTSSTTTTTTAEPTSNSSGGRGRNSTNNASSSLSMNQSLEGHNGHVQVVTWNEEHLKLTSSDQNGVIIVWMLFKGSWYEEMINNRNKSTVRGMCWSSNGLKICIVYEDGAVIVGSVEGNRIWGKDLKGLVLTAVQWSPDAKLLLFGSSSGEAHLYDEQGTFLTKLDNIGQGQGQGQAIVSLQWYDGQNGYVAEDCPVLAVCYQNGKLYLLRDASDDTPITVDCLMSVSCCVWNGYGSLLAVAGTSLSHERRDSNVISFFSTFGEQLKILKIPGKEVSGCSWEDGSLRLALSVDSNIYFANVRPDYKWAYFGHTVVFTDERVGRDGVCVTFWNTRTNARYFKYVRALLAVAAHGEHCVLAARNEIGQGPERFVLYVCNAISTPLDTKYLDLEPRQLCMNATTVVAAMRSHFLLWNFRAPRSSALQPARLRREKVYHVDDTPTGTVEMATAASPPSTTSTTATATGGDSLEIAVPRESSAGRRDTGDPICSICCSDKLLLLGRESGMLQQYALPQVTLSKRYATARRPCLMAINSDSTSVVGRSSSVEAAAADDDEERERLEDVAKFERKDAWAVCWAQDNPRLLAVMEKSRMYIFRGLEPEEPMNCAGYACCFKDLEIRCVLLDELVRQPESAGPELLQDLEVKSLRDTRPAFVRERPHPRLWRLLAEHALRALELDEAENALVRCADYLGIRFVKRLRGMHDAGLRRAEVLAYLGEYDAAERAYLELDRRDLAVTLRLRLGEQPRALQLMRLSTTNLGTGSGDAPSSNVLSDAMLERAEASWGEQLALGQQWRAAREHLERGGALERLLDCHYRLEEYEQLAAVAARLQEPNALRRAGRMLASVGMVQQAVACFVRCAELRLAVDTCVRANRWEQALELARTWRLPGIPELLAKYARHLLSAGRRLQAVELYRQADRPLEAARLLLDLAREQSGSAPPLRLKKLYVLAALLAQEALGRARPAGLLAGLAEAAGAEDARLLEEAWRGAEAYHFLLLAHRQLYASEPEAAMRTALRLREYEELLEQEPLYALLALASCACRALATCSRAFVRLEAIDPRYEELALELFACPNCASPFPACVVTGRPLMNLASAWLCTVCKHYAISEREVVNINSCPLCHSIITYM
ncbi:unnamed protein product [Trichogramma brassicae]|uniref:Uncharacterized protein n=1 Tax=Trichogramma brassicae TaxID=86971 RepID=A0A6H5IGQ8_9HYME|nr:unnamed protein product [Trichogramma brassicae]